MTRIRYSRQENGSYVSREPVLCGKDYYKVEIVLEETGVESFFNILSGGGEIFYRENTNNYLAAKKQAKSKLKLMGALFDYEVRASKKSVTTENVSENL